MRKRDICMVILFFALLAILTLTAIVDIKTDLRYFVDEAKKSEHAPLRCEPVWPEVVE